MSVPRSFGRGTASVPEAVRPAGGVAIEAMLEYTPLLLLLLPLVGLAMLCAAWRRPEWHGSIVGANVTLSVLLVTVFFVVTVFGSVDALGRWRSDEDTAASQGLEADGEGGWISGSEGESAGWYAASSLGEFRLPLELFVPQRTRGFGPPGTDEDAHDTGVRRSGMGRSLRIRLSAAVDAPGLWLLLGVEWAVWVAWFTPRGRMRNSRVACRSCWPAADTGFARTSIGARGALVLAFQAAAVGLVVVQDWLLWGCLWSAAGWIAWFGMACGHPGSERHRTGMLRAARWMIAGDVLLLCGLTMVGFAVAWRQASEGHRVLQVDWAAADWSVGGDRVAEALWAQWRPWAFLVASMGIALRVPWTPLHRWWHAPTTRCGDPVICLVWYGIAVLPMWLAVRLANSVFATDGAVAAGGAGLFAAAALWNAGVCVTRSSTERRLPCWLAFHAALILAAVFADDLLAWRGAAIVAGQLLPAGMLAVAAVAFHGADGVGGSGGGRVVRPTCTSRCARFIVAGVPGSVGFVGLVLELDGVFDVGALSWLCFVLAAVAIGAAILTGSDASLERGGGRASDRPGVSPRETDDSQRELRPVAAEGGVGSRDIGAGMEPQDRDTAMTRWVAGLVAWACAALLLMLGICPQPLVRWLGQG